MLQSRKQPLPEEEVIFLFFMQLLQGAPPSNQPIPTYPSRQQGLTDFASSLDLYLCLHFSKHRDRARHTHAPSAQLIATPQLILAADLFLHLIGQI